MKELLESVATIIHAVVAEINARREWPFRTKAEQEAARREALEELARVRAEA